jgi:hypothetical protein
MKARLTDQIRAQVVGQIQTQILGQGQGIVQVNFESGLMFAVLLLAAGAALNLYVLFHREENAVAVAGAGAPASSASVLGTGDAAGSFSSSPPVWKAASEPRGAPKLQAQAAGTPRVARFCRHCGTPVAEGKRFCSQCGMEITQRQETPKSSDVAHEEAPAFVPTVVPEVTVPPTAAAVFASTAPVAPFIAPVAEPPRAPSQYVESVPVETSFEPEEEAIVSVHVKRRGTTGWLITAIVSVLVISAAAFWTYEWHRGATLASLFGRSNTSEPAASPQVQPQLLAQVQPQQQTPVPESQVQQKPPAAVAEDHSAVHVTSSSAGKQEVTNPTHGKITVANGNVVSTTSQPQNQTPSPPPVVANPSVVNPPQQPTNGILHYSGPPVRLGETVTFAGLPGGRLRFTFDHSAWQPLISRHPDGTQTLTLRSLKQDVQTQCEVGWAIVQ